MTGVGTAITTTSRARVTVSAASVNHRFLDLQLRLPADLASLEAGVREAIGRRLVRGRVDLQVRVEASPERDAEITIDRRRLASLRRVLVALHEEGLIDSSDLTASDVLRLPQLLQIAADATEPPAELQEAALSAIIMAVDELTAAREAEGDRIGAVIRERITQFRDLVRRVGLRREELRREIHSGLQRRLVVLLEGRELPEDRLAVEVAILADRSDIAEEIDRLVSHLEHFSALMAGGDPVGKRMDFLCQELLREVNTLGSKSRDAGLTREVLEAKQLCEQIREQVQNIE